MQHTYLTNAKYFVSLCEKIRFLITKYQRITIIYQCLDRYMKATIFTLTNKVTFSCCESCKMERINKFRTVAAN